jgi:virulence-associated protein VagC
MLLTDQLDFNSPDHVTVCCKHDRLTIYIRNNSTSVRLTYQLQQEDNECTPPLPLQQS